ncbi:MAG: PAS domain-containing sensor histidine kinase [Rhodospirillaceae bacterium]|nr:PAS domain-containing sensor histidine kinase [Rhodospirillaceae bacterium]
MTNHKPQNPSRVFQPLDVIVTEPTSIRSLASSAGSHVEAASVDIGISPDPLLSLQPNGTILSVNQRAADMFSCHARLMTGAHIGAFLEGLSAPGERPSIERLISALLVGDGTPIETIAHKLNGSSLPIEITSAVVNQEGKSVVVAALRDITHRKHNEVALTTAKESAERANVAKLEFLSQLSHELRTPLAAAIGFAEVMRDEMFGPLGIKLYQTYAADICKSGRQLADVVERIIDVTRLEGRMALAHTRMADLGEIVERVMEHYAAAAAIQGIRMTHNLRRGSIPVVLDDDTLEKMIGHVVDNAITYNRFGGKVEIAASIEANDDSDVRQVLMTVTDNGPGFSTEQLKTLQTALDTNQHINNGGFALCSAFLHLIGGHLSICSAPNLGTTVTLTFPQRYDGRWHP